MGCRAGDDTRGRAGGTFQDGLRDRRSDEDRAGRHTTSGSVGNLVEAVVAKKRKIDWRDRVMSDATENNGSKVNNAYVPAERVLRPPWRCRACWRWTTTSSSVCCGSGGCCGRWVTRTRRWRAMSILLNSFGVSR